MTTAIIGAGLAGAAAARRLRQARMPVVVVDKGRAVGGRIATRRTTLERADGTQEVLRFDHGAPAVSGAPGSHFADFLEEARRDGVAAPWDGPADPGDTVGVPWMRQLVARALRGIEVTCAVTAERLVPHEGRWRIAVREGEDVVADHVIVTVPAPQSLAFTLPHAPAFAEAAQSALYAPCWTGLLAFPEETREALAGLSPDALQAEGVASLIHDGGKPDRGGATLVLHFGAAASREHLERGKDEMAKRVAALATDVLGLAAPLVVMAHRWRYSRVTRPAPLASVYDAATRIGIAGDWTEGPDAGDAFESGVRVAEALLSAHGEVAAAGG